MHQKDDDCFNKCNLGDKASVSWPQNSCYGSVGESRNSKIDEHRNVDLLPKIKLLLTVKTQLCGSG